MAEPVQYASLLNPAPPVPPPLAKLLSDVLSPAVTVSALLLVVSLHGSATIWQGLAWGLISVCFVTAIPYGFVAHGVRQRRYSDIHVGVRGQRPVILVLAICSLVLGLAALFVFHGPRDVVALVVAMGIGLMAALAITLVWKVSVHAAVMAGAATVLTLVFGPPMALTVVFVLAVAWARVAKGDHTLAQVLVGALVGGAVAYLTFPPLR